MYLKRHVKKRLDFSRTADFPFWTSRSKQKQPAQLYMIRATLWHVFSKLATVIENIANRMKFSDRLLVAQNFSPFNNSFVGKDVLTDHFALIKHFSSLFVVNRHIWYEDRQKISNDNWFIGLFSLK